MAEPETSDQAEREQRAEAVMARARGRLQDRGIDPSQVIGRGIRGEDLSVAAFYTILNTVSATEKAGQSPTYALARLALHSGLESEQRDTLYLAYNQQSAEEAGHGDKVFGNAYFAMGGAAPDGGSSVVGQGARAFLEPSEDPAQNRTTLARIAGVIGGIETGALQRVFPFVVSVCERWGHPVAEDLRRQIQTVVRPEEARHVLIWRYVFHHQVAPQGEAAVQAYYTSTNGGRAIVRMPPLERSEFDRMVGGTCPTPLQLLGKERTALA